MRTTSFGENRPLSLVDKVGIGLSNHKVVKIIQKFPKAPIVLDIGCGYNANLLKILAPFITKGYGFDISTTNNLSFDNLALINGPIEVTLYDCDLAPVDIILMISVIEHITDPLPIVKKCREILNRGGILIINVPTWRGKTFLEWLAFKWHLSPEAEMNDHKMYYDKRDLWPLLIKAGFLPSDISLTYHKFGLNLFCVCRNCL